MFLSCVWDFLGRLACLSIDPSLHAERGLETCLRPGAAWSVFKPQEKARLRTAFLSFSFWPW